MPLWAPGANASATSLAGVRVRPETRPMQSWMDFCSLRERSFESLLFSVGITDKLDNNAQDGSRTTIFPPATPPYSPLPPPPRPPRALGAVAGLAMLGKKPPSAGGGAAKLQQAGAGSGRRAPPSATNAQQGRRPPPALAAADQRKKPWRKAPPAVA